VEAYEELINVVAFGPLIVNTLPESAIVDAFDCLIYESATVVASFIFETHFKQLVELSNIRVECFVWVLLPLEEFSFERCFRDLRGTEDSFENVHDVLHVIDTNDGAATQQILSFG